MCSPTILQNVLSLILQIFLFLTAFDCNTTSDWLNRSCVTFKFIKFKLREKDKEYSRERKMVNKVPDLSVQMKKFQPT